MSKYINKTEFLKRYPSFSEHTDDEIEVAIVDAEALIDGYLSDRFVIPETNVPSVLIRIAGTLTYYYLMQANLQANSEDDYSKIYNSCVDLLQKIVSGTISVLELAESYETVSIISTAGDYEYR